MVRSWLVPARRATEATPAQVAATGASGGAYGGDPIDPGEAGWRQLGQTRREVPYWTQERARTYSVASYRSNPMARAIIDTYVSFCVGDSGVSYTVTNPRVQAVVDEFWQDPRNKIAAIQPLLLRDQLIMGETLLELMVGQGSGVVRFCPWDTTAVQDVINYAGNPLWPDKVVIDLGGDEWKFDVAHVDDLSGLRVGEAMWWTPFKTLVTDKRSMPFLMPVLDWLDSYDTVISNLIDRTALMRHMVYDVTVNGGQDDVDNYVQRRGGTHIPRSGTMEVHNEGVTIKPMHSETGAYEDSTAAKSVLTLVAGGAGLAKTWLAEPEDANRATSLTMAEPVRRRVQGVQKLWLDDQTELSRYAIDQAVKAKRLQAKVKSTNPRTGETVEIPASQTLTVTGPEVAAADAQITAQVLLNLSTGLEKLVQTGAMTPEAAAVAARKGWEDYMGIPYSADLGKPDANVDDIATAVDDAATKEKRLRAVPTA